MVALPEFNFCFSLAPSKFFFKLVKVQHQLTSKQNDEGKKDRWTNSSYSPKQVTNCFTECILEMHSINSGSI